MLRTFEQPGCLRISANARACKSCIESRILAIFRSVNLPQSSSCQRSLVECRQKLPLCTLARLAGPCARMGCDASSPWRRLAMRRTLRGLMAAPSILGICSYGGPDQAEFVATIKLVQPRPEGLASRQISRPRLTFREQPVGRFVQTLLLAASIRQMTN